MNLRSWTVKTKLYAAFTALALLATLISASALQALNEANRNLTQYVEGVNARAQLADQVRSAVDRRAVAARTAHDPPGSGVGGGSKGRESGCPDMGATSWLERNQNARARESGREIGFCLYPPKDDTPSIHVFRFHISPTCYYGLDPDLQESDEGPVRGARIMTR